VIRRSHLTGRKSQGRCRKPQVSIRFGEFILDGDSRRLMRAGETVTLSPKALHLLEVLVRAHPRVVSKETIIDTLWPDVAVEEANVRNLIAEIRRALGDKARNPGYIRTTHRTGYAFVAIPSNLPLTHAALCDDVNTYYLCEGANVVGRDSNCSVSIDTRGVSRRHARITVTRLAATIEDLGSKNGTWVNGQRIGECTFLTDEDLLAIGVARLTFRWLRCGGSTDTLRSGTR
jgi:DNA-binding winged helix-turn-helix (wHTH) protein